MTDSEISVLETEVITVNDPIINGPIINMTERAAVFLLEHPTFNVNDPKYQNDIIKKINRSKDKLKLVKKLIIFNYIFNDFVLSKIISIFSDKIIEWMFETKQKIGYLTLRNIVSVSKNIKHIKFLIQNNYKFDENIMQCAVASENMEIIELLYDNGYVWKSNCLKFLINNRIAREIVNWAKENNCDVSLLYDEESSLYCIFDRCEYCDRITSIDHCNCNTYQGHYERTGESPVYSDDND